ncbi:short chain dehydrogenase, putative [Ichthyophthirius multifiliis]|uniref:Short chain dehydrogenase, putative n=1 Tax=Ichthyophthirius multifiliis TaxID=5932 RepID=G0QWG0_ICHMU|nr:short chain dehydrogenase, putative [Ichthyophthirius multifiliis]EGR30443.1 short chain dehydrogenase, putative [Ichthyophthirius multifiliis]|eukprot:XP_004032030.1 short chain dehydrogenase, putative [Ichthyophthirius multifiliis]
MKIQLLTSIYSPKIAHDQLNKSPAKVQYTFSKTNRFQKTRLSYCQSAFYQLKSTLNQRATNLGLGRKSDFTKKDKDIPGPNQYLIKSSFDKQQSIQKGISFKLGREEISFRKMNEYTSVPGPGHYNQDDSKQKRLYHYSLGRNTQSTCNIFLLKIKICIQIELIPNYIVKFKDNPGPGTYYIQGMNKTGKYFISKYNTSRAAVFSPSTQNRFQFLYKGKQSPGPGQYEYEGLSKKGIYYNSKLRTTSGGKFSQSYRDTIGIRVKSEVPGPGSYRVVSEFGDTEFPPNQSVIIITGASSGIGRELALRYAQQNCKLLICSRDIKKLIEVQEMCNQLGGITNVIKCDVSQEIDCKSLIEECIKLYEKIDILILNAGINAHSPFQEIEDIQIFRKIMDTNFFGYVYPTKYALQHLLKNKGQIVVLSSISGEIGLPYRSAYCSSKFAVTGFFESLRIELNQNDISITIICPPSVKTDMRNHDLLQKYQQNDDELNRMSVEECVKIVMFAIKKRARKIFFPFKAYFAVYLRPFFPDYVDRKLKQAAKL